MNVQTKWNCLIPTCLLWSSHFKDEQFSFARGVGLVIGVRARAHRMCTRAQSDRVNCARRLIFTRLTNLTKQVSEQSSFSSELE